MAQTHKEQTNNSKGYRRRNRWLWLNAPYDKLNKKRGDEMITDQFPILNAIMKRRSIRLFKETPLTPDTIEALLIAAMSAPTAANAEPWEFIVIDDQTQLRTIYEKFVFARYKAPLAIVVCGNLKLAFKGPGKDMWIQDCSAATENILIAAANMDLGAVWIGVHPIEHSVKTLRTLLNIPEDVVPLNIIYIGYPDEFKEPRSRYNEKRIYWNSYDPLRKHRKKDKPKIGHY